MSGKKKARRPIKKAAKKKKVARKAKKKTAVMTDKNVTIDGVPAVPALGEIVILPASALDAAEAIVKPGPEPEELYLDEESFDDEDEENEMDGF